MNAAHRAGAFRALALPTILIAVLAWSTPGQAQSSSDTNNRLQRLENDVQTLSRAIYKGEEPPPGAFIDSGAPAQTEVRMQQLENDLRTLTGKLEEQSYQIRQLQEQLERSLGDMEVRMNDLQRTGSVGSSTSTTGGSFSTAPQYTAPPPAAAPQPQENYSDSGSGGFQYSTGNAASGTSTGGQLGSYTETPAGNTAAGGDQAAADYENAFALLKASNYDSAERAFGAFLSQYPGHVLTPNAKYWYGETFYVRGQYERAARIFAEAYQADPKGSKAADNLLKMGMSLAGMGNKEDACLALGQLNNDENRAASPVMRRAQQEMTRLGC